MIMNQLRQGYERENDFVLNDLLRPAGFIVAVAGTLRIVEQGLLMGGLPCSSYIFMSSGTHRRSVDSPWGHEAYRFVFEGNQLGSKFLLLCFLAVVRQVKWFVENPQSSVVHALPPLRFLLAKRFLGGQIGKWWGSQ